MEDVLYITENVCGTANMDGLTNSSLSFSIVKAKPETGYCTRVYKVTVPFHTVVIITIRLPIQERFQFVWLAPCDVLDGSDSRLQLSEGVFSG